LAVPWESIKYQELALFFFGECVRDVLVNFGGGFSALAVSLNGDNKFYLSTGDCSVNGD
jgi:hypothetical protein